MFYSTELLSLRRKGKLARCWLAATVSEKMFKKFCKPNLISKIDVYRICEEILLTIEIRDRRNYGRFSLYLSSQLMYGVTKILFYQTKIFQDYLFCIYKKLVTVHSSESSRSATGIWELPDVPIIDEVFRNLETSSNLHLIAEEPYTSVIEHLMQNEMNFGVLTSQEMEKFICLGGEEQSLNDVRKFRWDNSEEIIDESKLHVPLVDIDQFQMDTIETEKETRLASTRRDQPESLIAIEDDQLKKPGPIISRKRSIKYPEEVATKKRKISPEEKTPPVLEPLLESVAEPIPIPEGQEQAKQILEHEALIGLTKTKKKRKIFDKYKKLSDTAMQKGIQNVTAHTIKYHLFATILPSSTEYLTQPSVTIFNRLQGKSLIKLFKQHLIGPFIAQNEYETLDFEVEETIPGETIRADTSSKLRDQTGELSSKLAITTIDTTDQSKILEKIPPINDFQPRLSEENHKKEANEGQEPVVELPDITDIEDKIREPFNKLEKFTNGRKSKSASVSSEIYLTKQELLALMEIQWHERRIIKFEDLISPESYSKKDAVYAFSLCLEFHKERVVILKQAECFSTIWIEKYPCYSSGTDEDAVAS